MDNSRRYTKEDSFQEDHHNILAFGYSCKLFRDDEKAEDINQGSYLIPCISDENLMIDRFDVRGVLTDLNEAESKGDGELQLTDVQQMEQNACEYESYCDYEVYNHYNDEERVFHDEEQKRLQMALAADTYTYNQVDFSYSNEATYISSQASDQHQTDSPTQITDGETFVPTTDLNLPTGMQIPKTTKQHKIILKTGKFVASHGAQMEIVLMTKQAGNSSFSFMSFDNVLNPYYKHIINQIKTGRLKFNRENEGDDGREAHESNSQFNLPQVTPDLTPGVTTTPFKPSAHCTYSNLITKIREKQKASGVEESEMYSPSMPSSPITYVAPIPVREKTNLNSTQPSLVATPGSQVPIVGLVDYPTFNHAADSSEEEDSNSYSCKTSSNSLGLEGGGGSYEVYDYNKIKWPSPDLQMVIDKLACYIVKNGPAFRDIVKNKNDHRFQFLNSGHEYNPYFQCKMHLYSEVYGDTFIHQQMGVQNQYTPVKGTSIQRTKYSAKGSRAISFSIKSKDVEAPLSSHTTFPVESSTSDEEMEDEEREQRRSLREQKRLENKLREEKSRKERDALLLKERNIKEKNVAKGQECASDNDDLYDIFKYAQNLAKDKGTNYEAVQKTQLKQKERKMKAAAFVGKINSNGSTNGAGPPVYGPHLPIIVKSNMEMLSHVEEYGSSNSSLHSGSNNERVKDSVSPPLSLPSVSEDSTRNWLMKEVSSSPKQLIEKITTRLSPFIGEIPDDDATTKYSGPVFPKEEWSRSRHKKSRKRSGSWSPEHHRDKKKKKKSHSSSRRRKRRHSRSRSKDRSKSHRSSHKKRKHVSHKEKLKKKKHRKYRSPSLSSLSSDSSKSSSNFPSDSDSEVQVISPNTRKEPAPSSRSSSVMSLSEVKTVSDSRGGSLSTDDENSEKTSSTTITDNVSQHPPALETAEDTCNSVSDLQKVNKAAFAPMKSSAMAKITEGLRAKLHAMLEKDANV